MEMSIHHVTYGASTEMFDDYSITSKKREGETKPNAYHSWMKKETFCYM